MTTNEQRIAIAKACGFADIMLPMGFHQQLSDEKSKQCGGRWRFEIPDYLNDLNACHQMEKVLTADQWYEYDRLMPLRDPQKMHATAAQKCNAFLRTLGLWQPTEPQPK